MLPLTVFNLSIWINFEKKFCFGRGAGLLVVYVSIRNPYLLHDLSIQCQVPLVIVFSKPKTGVVPTLPQKESALKLLQKTEMKKRALRCGHRLQHPVQCYAQHSLQIVAEVELYSAMNECTCLQHVDTIYSSAGIAIAMCAHYLQNYLHAMACNNYLAFSALLASFQNCKGCVARAMQT